VSRINFEAEAKTGPRAINVGFALKMIGAIDIAVVIETLKNLCNHAGIISPYSSLNS
jgi:hypothetical protein